MTGDSRNPRSTMSRIACLALTVCLMGSLLATCLAPGWAAAAPDDDYIDVRSWRFQEDPVGRGVASGWHLPGFDDRAWISASLPVPLADQGIAQKSDVGWYRTTVSPRHHWQTAVIALFLRGDAEFTVFVNGVELVTRAAGIDYTLHPPMVVDLGSHFRPAQDNVIAVQVRTTGDNGRPSSDVRIGPRLAATVSARDYLRHIQDVHPGEYPSWVEERPTAWTMAGVSAGQRKSLIGNDGAFSPSNPGYTLVPWVVDNKDNVLRAPHHGSGVETRLRGGHLPIVEQSWSAAGARIESTLFVSDGTPGPAHTPDFDLQDVVPDRTANSLHLDPLVHYRLIVSNPGQTELNLALYLAIRPYDVRGGIWPVYRLEYRSEWQSVLVNGLVGPHVDRPASGFGATTLADGDVSTFIRQGQLPPASVAVDVDGYAMGALRYDLRLPPGGQEVVTMAIPVELAEATSPTVEHLAGVSFARRLATAEDTWRYLLHRVELELPQPEMVDAFYASLAYILVAQSNERFHPGPLAHNAFWVRDTAYIAQALNRAGLSPRVRPVLRQMLDSQRPSGEFPPIIEPDGTPRDVEEWDSQGQAIFALTQHYRFTGDADFLRDVFPAIERAVDFIAHLRGRTVHQPAPFGGILPPSLSAEDIGPADWQHYWDDFWALAGLQEARAMALVLGNRAAAERFLSEETALRDALMTSIQFMKDRYNQPQRPTGPHDIGNTSDARGTSAAMWPLEVLPDERPLLRDSFEHYFKRWIEPYGGGYFHHLDLIWPYAGLGLAQGYLRLGMYDELWTIMDWTMKNQTVPGAYAWAEGVHPTTGGFGIGDMPHGWFGAEFVNLLRDILITEQNGRLVIASGVPLRWLTAGEPISINHAPTTHGLAGYRLVGHLTASSRQPDEMVGIVRLTRLGTARPPNGHRLVLPFDQRPTGVTVDGRPLPVESAREIDLPGEFGEVLVTFGVP
ncbi:MAG TPA: beta galactosidase jelly roll domain-containing protein [Chloroflexota bacterium]|nr:beta galactosidase jelly roll domain-containing protein [Chloroflexota bacterium]